MDYTIKNHDLEIRCNSLGGELKSIRTVNDGFEYIWCGDPKFWKRSSPTLFPFVGALKNNRFQYHDKLYNMSQHGFARDLEHEMISRENHSLVFRLMSTAQTKTIYPFDFSLETRYELIKRSLKVTWSIKNLNDNDMPFSIGAHPAFLCDLNSYSLRFDTKDNNLKFHKINQAGLYKKDVHVIPLVAGELKLSSSMFRDDALIVENDQAHDICLINESGKKQLSIKFDAPLFGLWSPAGKNAPFICIEPWYGRCDEDGFNGQLEDKSWIQILKPKSSWRKSYTIEIF